MKKSITGKSEKRKRNKFIILGVIILISLGVYLQFFSNFKLGENKMVVVIDTSMGVIEVELNESAAPITVENFLAYVDEGFFDETIFHRVIDGFMIQGGGMIADGTQKETKDPIVLESNNGLKNDRGTIAMARTMDPNSATSQFFINTVDNDFLNYGVRDDGYAVFGKVISGMDVVDKISKVEVLNNPPNWPKEPVIINSIKRK